MTERPLRIDWNGQTDKGSVRANNEDCFAARPDIGVWAVADGIGGHNRGDWASAAIAAEIDALSVAADFDALMASCSNAVHKANRTIFAAGAESGERIGSTIVALVIHERRFGIIWAGDSRAYLLRDGQLIQLTQDHTQVQLMVERGLLTPEEALSHPMGHVLSKAVGVEEVLELEAIADMIQAGDMFLLCSDGVHGVLGKDEIAAIMATGTAEMVPSLLIERCLVVGAKDNATAVVAQAQEPTVLVFAPAGGIEAP